MTSVLIPVLSNKTLRSWPKNPEGGRVDYLPLDVALRSRFHSDAHFAAYHFPGVARRLCVDLVRDPSNAQLVGDGVTMVLAAFDVDYPGAHKTESTDVEHGDWWVTEKRKLSKLHKHHKGAFVYRTRGGYRILYVLGELVTIRNERDDVMWTATYLSWVAYLCRRFDIVADRSCSEWVRLFRLPHATRDEGGRPEEMDSLGDPKNVGGWHCDPSYDDVAAAAALNRRKIRTVRPVAPFVDAGDGVLFYAFRSRGWIGKRISDGKWAVVCPWESSHSRGARLDTSTVLYAPGHGERTGWFHCSHTHCGGRGVREVLALFSRYELDDAQRAAGIAA